VYSSSKHIVRHNFTVVDNYAVFTAEGTLHIGKTIRKYLDDHHVKYSRFAEDIGMTRGGFARTFDQMSINTERLAQISNKLGHDFFKYLLQPTTQEQLIKASDPAAAYQPEKKKKPLKVTLQFDDGDPDMDSPLILKLNEIIRQLNESQE
jgi:hypothetical protein